ncbi:hypothetical protein V494_01180 [Pseudogymnoascus sp. VKM F-4513 (FW-928)]|nr:hypothetical protein V494_01180 [Pseudogymnoascus sp. VKM F-4513 (FW-928)]
MPRPRWRLRLEAFVWRNLMDLGMFLHRLRSPRPLSPSFRRNIPVTVSPRKGTIDLLFYVPRDNPRRHSENRASRYPVLVNFHAGGFTIGKASDDARWATAVVETVGAVVVSVNYRLAPRYPFPTAVEDGVDAILYLVQNAEQLNIDADKIGVSGFSSGGNMAFTVPLMLHNEIRRRRERCNEGQLTTDVPRSEGEVVVIMSWYPATDFATNTREERRKTNIRPGQELPEFFTQLFDTSYLYPPHGVSLSDSYLSPGVAPDDILRALPEDIIICTCEWDGLRAEAERFKDRLIQVLKKRVHYRMIAGVSHAWDKSPNLFKRSLAREQAYREACIEVKRVFDNNE